MIIRSGRAALGLGVLLGLHACANEPQWRSVAADFELDAVQRVGVSDADTGRARLEPAGEHAWIVWPIERADWSWRQGPAAWGALVPIRGRGRPAEGAPQRLTGPDGDYEYFAPTRISFDEPPPLDSFLYTSGGVFLRLAEGVEPPPLLELRLFVSWGAKRDGTWRVPGRRFHGEGLVLGAGDAFALELDLDGDSRLTFASVLEPAVVDGLGDARETIFRIDVDGREAFRHTVTGKPTEHVAWHALELPAGERQVVFRVAGDLAHTAFLAPVIGPAAIGRRGARPWGEARNDIVLFVADTFRADNLRAYGGSGEFAPELDRLAAEARVFSQAWSTSTYTFPAHASMFTGLYPREAGAVGTGRALPPELTLVSEHLRAAGWRTGAVTDGAMVSQRHGFARGFAYFDEELIDLDSTLERALAFLDADDGRPSFLFVHTYRTHTPFHASDEVVARHGDLAELDYETLERERLARFGPNGTTPGHDSPEARELVGKLEALYRGGVRDLDLGFAGFVRALEERGVLPAGTLVFTSDHGEAFAEHDEVYHTGTVFEEQLRVPLLLLGGAYTEGRRVDAPVSLVDLAPTLADLAGVPFPGDRSGLSLLRLPAEPRPIFAFQCWGELEASSLAVIAGGRKVIASEDPDARQVGMRAFELQSDPGEREDRGAEPWAAELLERFGPRLEALARPRHASSTADLDAEDLAELRALGYAE